MNYIDILRRFVLGEFGGVNNDPVQNEDAARQALANSTGMSKDDPKISAWIRDAAQIVGPNLSPGAFTYTPPPTPTPTFTPTPSVDGLTALLKGAADLEPRKEYFGFSDQFGGRTALGRGQKQRDYFQNQFENIHDEFTGQIARNVRLGEDPSQRQTFTEFLGEFPFSQRFASLPPSMRGGQRGRFAPQAAFRF